MDLRNQDIGDLGFAMLALLLRGNRTLASIDVRATPLQSITKEGG